MSFRVHPSDKRIVDAERGLELVFDGMGPMGWTAYSVRGLPDRISFLAVQTVTPESKGPPGDYSGDPMWQIILQTRYSEEKLEDYEPIVAGAMIAHRATFGWSAHDKPYCVEILPWGTDYEERGVRGRRYTEADV